MDYSKYFEINSLCVELKREMSNLHGDEKETAEEILKESVKLLESLCLENIDNIHVPPQRVKKEIIFLPYKAAMWDSLESIWMAADADPDCIARVIPIPYFTADTDGNLTVYNYEAEQLPDYVPITRYDQYDIAANHPDAVYIHYPYSANNVTRLCNEHYAENIKPHTNKLIYVPYYSTSGGMSVDQRYLPSYHCVDYIVTQAPFIHSFFDETLPEGRLQPFGSPKFDRIIRMCANPPKPPIEWQRKLEGKKVYFLNTSIGGMLFNTKNFINRLNRVLHIFENRKDACLIWRPHPLLENTFKSIRTKYLPVYYKLVEYFKTADFGIWDDTPDMSKTIALSDCYIGDSYSSVTSVFGVVGKPMFIFNLWYCEAPLKDSWKNTYLPYLNYTGYAAVGGSQLFYDCLGKYKYIGQLGKYSWGWNYGGVWQYGEFTYICPAASKYLLKMKHGELIERIPVVECDTDKALFYGSVLCGKYMCLLPNQHDAFVIYDLDTGKIKNIRRNVQFLGANVRGMQVFASAISHHNKIYIALAAANNLMELDPETGKIRVINLVISGVEGFVTINSDGENLWLLPMIGNKVLRIDIERENLIEYVVPEEIYSINPNLRYIDKERLFSNIAFHGEKAYCAPRWGNEFVVIDKQTSVVKIWKTPLSLEYPQKNKSYYASDAPKTVWGYYLINNKDAKRKLYSYIEAKWYDVDLCTETFTECDELNNALDRSEAKLADKGFSSLSSGLRYACNETAFNSLEKFLDGKIIGAVHNETVQKLQYSELAANNDGTCGEKVHKFIMENLR